MDEQNTISLYVEGGVWQAEWTGPFAARVKELFGTAIIATPYLAVADGLRVAAEVRGRNPGVRVVVCD